MNPGLGPFRENRVTVTFLELLNPNFDGHAHVFKVVIRRQIFALKVVSFYRQAENDIAD